MIRTILPPNLDPGERVESPTRAHQLAINGMRQEHVIYALKHYRALLLRLRAERDELLADDLRKQAMAAAAARMVQRDAAGRFVGARSSLAASA